VLKPGDERQRCLVNFQFFVVETAIHRSTSKDGSGQIRVQASELRDHECVLRCAPADPSATLRLCVSAFDSGSGLSPAQKLGNSAAKVIATCPTGALAQDEKHSGKKGGAMARDVDPDLSHRLNCERMHVASGFCPQCARSLPPDDCGRNFQCKG